jgi:hypothetical protein
MAARPFRLGDFRPTDEAGDVVENVLIDEVIFLYRVEHAAREVRITEIVVP